MTSSEILAARRPVTRRLEIARAAAGLAVHDYRAVYPWPVLLGTALPRVLLQVAFLAYVGETGGGAPGLSFALIGACVHVVAVSTLVRGPTAVLEDRPQGTLFRQRLAGVSPFTVALARSWVFAAQASAEGLLAVLVVVPLLGPPGLLTALLPALPLIVLVVLTTTVLGSAVAAVSLFVRNDVLLTNLASYLLMALCGVVFPLGDLPAALEWPAYALPLTNGLLAVRAVVDGDGWFQHAAAEAAVGVAWAAVAALLFAAQDRHARGRGTDDSF